MALRWGWMAALILVVGVVGGCKKQPQAESRYDLSLESNQRYLVDNAARAGVTTLPSGLQYRIIKAGTGNSPVGPDDLVTVTYKGWMIDGTVFDRTRAGATAQFSAGGVIPGWIEALSLMKEGDEWEIVLPADIAYGDEGKLPVIPPNQTLVFVIGLLAVTHAN